MFLINSLISIISQVDGNSFTYYIAENGNTFSELSSLQETKAEKFQNARDANALMAWIIRAGATIMIIFGFRMVFAPLVVLADIIPFLGNIVSAGTSLAALLIGLAWALIVLAFSWFRFRPLLSLILISIAIAVIVYDYWKGRKIKFLGSKKS